MKLLKFSELIALRAKYGVSQKKICKEIGVANTTYSRKENGKIVFTLDELIEISLFFKLSKDDIYTVFFANRLREKQRAV